MESSNRYDGLDPRAIRTVRHYARRLARRQTNPGMEIEDYEQDLMLDLVRRLRHYDAGRASLATFIETVVRHRVADLAARPAGPETVSLDQPVGQPDDDDAPMLGDALDAAQSLWREPGPLATDLPELRVDLRRFVDGLPPSLQRCCGWLLVGSVQEAARQAGVHRDTVYDGRRRLKEHAVRAGLGIFFPAPSDRSRSRPVYGL